MFTPLISRGGGLLAPGGGMVRESTSIPFFPATAAEMASLIGATPSHMLTFQETSGDIIDRVGSADLTPSGAVLGEATSLPDASVAMRFNGGDGNSDNATAGNTTDYSAGSGSFAIVGTIKVNETPGSARSLVNKFLSGTGYVIEVASSLVRIKIDDGPNVVQPSVGTSIATTAAWFSFAVVINRTTGAGYVYLSSGENGSADISSVTGSLDAAIAFSVGLSADSLDASHRLLAFFAGAEAEAINQAGLNAYHANAGL